jgi:hypothetical protein
MVCSRGAGAHKLEHKPYNIAHLCKLFVFSSGHPTTNETCVFRDRQLYVSTAVLHIERTN